MVIPFLGWDFKMASTSGRKGCYVLRDKKGLELKGGLYPSHMPDGSLVLLFLGSPRLATLEDLQVCSRFPLSQAVVPDQGTHGRMTSSPIPDGSHHIISH